MQVMVYVCTLRQRKEVTRKQMKNESLIFLVFVLFCRFFVVDASEAGEGQLEISINEGEVPNHVTVVGGGRCLVSFTPEQPKPHLIDIKFNGETVSGKITWVFG